MKKNNVFKYLAFSLLLYGLFFGGELLLEHLRKVYSVTYEGKNFYAWSSDINSPVNWSAVRDRKIFDRNI